MTAAHKMLMSRVYKLDDKLHISANSFRARGIGYVIRMNRNEGIQPPKDSGAQTLYSFPRSTHRSVHEKKERMVMMGRSGTPNNDPALWIGREGFHEIYI